ncbi:MAG: 2Fe-2S ferredoxin [Alphaproteobacteria bacterium]|jgi:ferredoxin|uniref:ferredoxin family 2Fe-2S iron-sulfur cluster binding protein n=1 Tax=Candidatus Megaera polyxenophila TaxID=988779 RepID=UPI001CC3B64B|nr:ferredoxin family 2Fe-2S iron-sulfur cluster binding protein [Candidatus Megaera polyxenophila]MBU6184574.1 ferredoxin family 2Fe-2S iron-sulfur cluster binding protein [Rickettsiales bacterium]MCE2731363.1 ferredoxin family 2Fe-2S iron-sulfur cluster binding protein [Rickettsiaceae bacterium]NBY35632.1 2Fe-2S ferredoxin [Alphaproteobacteria bacterium]UCM93802.1 MAG: ferredoxin family 2Fe-2S iron-sulfur cluster binding protein [Candidatus Megaira endosymbiont of Mesostigma viride]HJK85399.1
MKPEKIKIIFIENNKEIEVEASVGLSVLEVAHENNIDLEGACEGSLACATCHVILEEKIYNILEQPAEAEEDMLDLAFGLTHTSRLGCQIILTKELNGMRVRVPSATRNISI